MINLQNAAIFMNGGQAFKSIDIKVAAGECSVIFGGRGAERSALLECFYNPDLVTDGTYSNCARRVGIVSLREQERLILREETRDDSDLTDQIFPGTPVFDLLEETSLDKDLLAHLIDSLDLNSLLGKGFRKLSSGESKKIILARALSIKPDLLLLEDPLEGLDSVGRTQALSLIGDLSRSVTKIYSLSRVTDIPEDTNKIFFLESNSFVREYVCQSGVQARYMVSSITKIESREVVLPPPAEKRSLPTNPDGSLVNIRNATVKYTENTVFENLDLRINPGSHWQIKGPNGSGKTTLLNLINGDHPQSYVNNICVFGFRKGEGETIWEIKRNLGFVSNALHWDHRISVSVINVIVSGFFDTIGLYSNTSDLHYKLAYKWLELLGLENERDQRFTELSFGQQRLILICRAMVKHPPLLLLDEPCRGLDDADRQLVIALINRLCADGDSTIVYVTHDLEDEISFISNSLELV